MIASLQVVIFFVFYIAIFGLSVWALIDLLRRPATAFPQAGKRTKGFWGAIVGVATAVSFSVIPIPGVPHLPSLNPLAALALTVWFLGSAPGTVYARGL